MYVLLTHDVMTMTYIVFL